MPLIFLLDGRATCQVMAELIVMAVAAQEERTIDRPMTVEKFSMGGRGVILCDR